MAFLDDVLGTGLQRLAIGEAGGDPIVVDASIREVHSVSGEVSEHPVENGVDIVDHYRVLPRQLDMEAVVSDTPIVSSSLSLPGETLLNSAIGLIEGDEKPSTNAWVELQRFFDEAVVLEIKTSLETYTSMVLTDLSVVRDASNGQVLFFSASARQIRFVDTEEGQAIALPAEPSGQKKKSVAKKTNKAANESQGKLTSGLAKGLDAAKNLFR